MRAVPDDAQRSEPAARRPPDHDVRREHLRHWLRTGFWFAPLVCVLSAMVLSTALTILDDQTGGDTPRWLVFRGSASAAQSVLSTIAGSTLTFTGAVFSITIVALQLASSQYSPRVLQGFLRDRGSQWSLGIFLATFTFALMTLRAVHPDPVGDQVAVPGLSVSMALLLVLVSLGAFVYLVHHLATSIRSVSIVDRIAGDTRRTLRQLYPTTPDPLAGAPRPTGEPDQVVTFERGPGVLLAVDEDDLVELAQAADVHLVLRPRIGDYLPSGVWVFAVHGGRIDPAAALRHVLVGPERTHLQDLGFGFRQLVDIAERALSPAVNDPTTAVQCIDRIHDLLRRVVLLPEPSGHHVDDRGVIRLSIEHATWDNLVHLACDEIRIYGGGSLQVQRRLRAMLADLERIAPAERAEPLAHQRLLLDAALTHFSEAADRDRAAQPDAQGVGD
jgi:uncharacterized membrane protein